MLPDQTRGGQLYLDRAGPVARDDHLLRPGGGDGSGHGHGPGWCRGIVRPSPPRVVDDPGRG